MLRLLIYLFFVVVHYNTFALHWWPEMWTQQPICMSCCISYTIECVLSSVQFYFNVKST